MIINKLMTLSQFVDWQYSEVDPNTLELLGHNVVNYNSYLKQPLTKDMFINEIEKPLHIFSDDPDENKSKMYQKSKDVIKWKEAESKVIFKGWNLEKNEYKYKQFGVVFFNDGYIGLYDNLTKHNFRTQTLSDLAESTNGELQIKLEL